MMRNLSFKGGDVPRSEYILKIYAAQSNSGDSKRAAAWKKICHRVNGIDAAIEASP